MGTPEANVRCDHDNDDYHHNDYGNGISGATASVSVTALLSDGLSVSPIRYPNGRFALIRASSVLSTRAILLNKRLRLALLDDIRWRRDDCERNTLPVAVILNLLATAFRVLLRAIDFGIGRER